MSEEQLKEVFRNNLKLFLEKRGKTQNDLAIYLNVSATTVNNWVKGYNSPRMDKIDDICQFLNIRRSQLIGVGGDSYYTNPETARIAQEIFDNKELGILFDAAKDAPPEDLRFATELFMRMKRQAHPEDEFFPDEEFDD